MWGAKLFCFNVRQRKTELLLISFRQIIVVTISRILLCSSRLQENAESLMFPDKQQSAFIRVTSAIV